MFSFCHKKDIYKTFVETMPDKPLVNFKFKDHLLQLLPLLWFLIRNAVTKTINHRLLEVLNQWTALKQGSTPIASFLNTFSEKLTILEGTYYMVSVNDMSYRVLKSVDQHRYSSQITKYLNSNSPIELPSFSSLKQELINQDVIEQEKEMHSDSAVTMSGKVIKMKPKVNIKTLGQGQCQSCDQQAASHPNGCPNIGTICFLFVIKRTSTKLL